MITSVFFLTKTGDVILFKELLPSNKPTSPVKIGLMYKKNGKSLSTIIQKDGIYYTFSEQDKVVAVAASDDGDFSSIIILQSLYKICSILQDLIGLLTEQTLHSNIGLVIEVINSSFCCGMPVTIDTMQLKSALANLSSLKYQQNNIWSSSTNLFFKQNKKPQSSVSGDTSKKPIFTHAEEEEIFVDLTEKINLSMNSKGIIDLCEIQGDVKVKSCLNTPAKVVLQFSETSFNFLDISEFNLKVERNEKNPLELSLNADPGISKILSYKSFDYSKINSIPFSIYANIQPKQDNKTIDIQFKVHYQLSTPVINFKGLLNLPSNVISCQGKSNLFSMKFKKENEKYVFTCPEFPPKSHFQVDIQVLVSSITPLTSFELSTVVLKFEIPMYSLSKMKIKCVMVEKAKYNQTQDCDFVKWIRQLTYTDSYEFALDTSKLKGLTN